MSYARDHVSQSSPPRRGRRQLAADHLLLRPIDLASGQTLQDGVYRQLRGALMVGAFRPGESLSSRGIAAELGVSTMPVKDALRRLAAEGVLQALPQSGFRVCPLTPERFLQLIEARVRLEGLVASRTAKIAPRSLIDQLHALNAGYRSAGGSTGLRGELLLANHDFHFTIYGAAGMPDVCELIVAAWLRTGSVFSLIEAQLDREDDFQRHARIIDAIARHDGEAAARTLESDIRASANRIAPLLQAV